MQSHDEPTWGEPPLGEVLARLVAERYPIATGEAIAIDVDEDKRSIRLTLRAVRHHFVIGIRYLRGAGKSRDPWMMMVDALDALYGSFDEAGRDHRSLPTGTDVEFVGAFFAVTVEHRIPDLEKLADQLLDVTPRES